MTGDSVMDDRPVDVFVHARTELPGAWTDDEFAVLLNAWEDVLENSTSKSINVAHRVMKRLVRIENFREVKRDGVHNQIKLLRKEFIAYEIIRTLPTLNVYRHPCVDQLERILVAIPQSRKRTRSTGAVGDLDATKDSDPNNRLSISSEGDDAVKRGTESTNPNHTEVPNRKTRVRAPGGVNLHNLIGTMVNQQQTISAGLEDLFKSLEASNAKIVSMMETLVLQKSEPSTSTVEDELVGLAQLAIVNEAKDLME